MENQPNYYAVIPARVRYAKIMANAKLLYGEITALSNDKGYCWASNSYFAKLYGVSEKQISAWFKQLADHRFIDIEISRTKDGTIRKVFLLEEAVIRTLRKGKVQSQPTTPKGEVATEVSTTPKGNTNNTSINNTENFIEISGNQDHRGQHSPTKERIKQLLKTGGVKELAKLTGG